LALPRSEHVKVLIVEPGQFRTNLAATGMRHMPVAEAYRDIIGSTRDFAHAMNGTQEGDPRRAAAAIEAALDSPNTPLRLQLGGDAVGAVRAHSDDLLNQLADWEGLARSTRFDAQAA
jgi:hypothetical protein